MTKISILSEFSTQQVADAARTLYHIEGRVQRLNGERDLNFLIDSGEQQFVFKISHQTENVAMLECQHIVFQRLSQTARHKAGRLQMPKTIQSRNGKPFESIISARGHKHLCRMVSFISGRLLSAVNPQTPALLENLGETVGEIDLALVDFKHPAIERALLWNMNDAISTLKQCKPLLDDDERIELIDYFQNRFAERVMPVADKLRFGAIHNDVNDHNVIVTGSKYEQQRVKGVIDYGDMVYSWIAVDPAVAAAYAMLDKPHPLDVAASVIKGYHRKFPLSEVEISVLFELMCMRLCLSVCICASHQALSSDNPYLRISEQSAWATLHQIRQIPADFAHYLLRACCGYPPVPISERVTQWLRSHSAQFNSIVHANLKTEPLLIVDASVGSVQMPNASTPIDPIQVAKTISRTIEEQKCVAAIGKYDEYRLIYNSADFTDVTGHRRTLHLGIDVFTPAESTIYAPLGGQVYGMDNDDTPMSYGGVLILQHDFSDAQGRGTFYTLYGHLKPASLAPHTVGDSIESGQKIADIGEIHENGHWPPHVHFQIITDMLGRGGSFAGVGTHAHRNVWLNLCPDANLILGIPDAHLNPQTNDPNKLADSISSNRTPSLNPAPSPSYRQPIHVVRGSMQYLYDYTGRQYLDTVNNVSHVGHCHPNVVVAMQQQSGVLTANTHYLHAQIASYSERLLAKFPTPLDVCFLVNSGSEANDLALRLARNYTRQNDTIVLDHAYHGNLTSLIEISPYKHNGVGGVGAPSHIHPTMMPDMYRYSGADSDALLDYVDSLKEALQSAEQHSGVAAFIAESMLGCGGQIVLPDGYLSAVYQQIRDSGGLCIADEVQTGFGRVGSHYWAFQTQHVIPDIVTLGKPMGNGHPLGAVITTREIADAFNNGMDCYNIAGNSFGGNPVSCAIGTAVLDVIEQENLQQHTADVGAYFHQKLNQLKSCHPIIGDVRGLGLFIGVELVNNHHDMQPAVEQANYIVERMQQKGILTASGGALHNVLKIKPPLCFTNDNVEQFTTALDDVLKEDFAQPDIIGLLNE